MTSSDRKISSKIATDVRFKGEWLQVELADGLVLEVSLEGYPRLAEGDSEERSNWELLGDGLGIHWPDLDEDINVESLLAGKTSGEAAESLNRWRAQRKHSA